MKKNHSHIIVIAAFLILISTSCKKELSLSEGLNKSIGSEAEKSQVTKMKEILLKGEYTTTNEILQGPPLVKQKITGVGQSAHLGNSTFIAYPTINVSTPPPFQITGTATFMAADGSQFYTAFTGTNTPNEDKTIATIFVTHHITGGTGRFQNASGTFVGNGYTIMAEARGAITYDGTINY